MLLRPATSHDLATIQGWLTSVQDMVMWSGPTFTWPLDPSQFEHYLADSRRHCWAGLDPETGQLMGHASLRVDDAARVMRLGCIIIDPALRGQGRGRQLVTMAIQAGFDATDLPAMTLGVYAHNAPARGLYESLGFQRAGAVLATEVSGETWQSLEMELPRPS